MTAIEIGTAVWAAIIFTLAAAWIGLRLYRAWAEWELARRRRERERPLQEAERFIQDLRDITADRPSKKGKTK